ncbi:protein phosphatase PTC7 homolog fig [Drosophila tropicalis]|uniref:protein phosphatase PTC7 homolog fig n=1 Tax=Drosophila tropicalis TaxID=46794 RepID=UPI0035ABC831
MLSSLAGKLQGKTKFLIDVLKFYNTGLLQSSSMSGVGKRRDPFLVKVVQGRSRQRSICSAKDNRYGEDSWFFSSTPKAEVMGVADGVGGWSELGIDAGLFARELMFWCSNYAKRENFDGRKPLDLLIESNSEIKGKTNPVVGSSTACLVSLNRRDCTMHSANLGDSGFMVIRNGRLLHRSEEQVHDFNSPYQLTVVPNERLDNVYCDRPESADSSRLPLQEGDLVLLATDGLFDNVPESLIVKTLSKYQGVTRKEDLQLGANSLVDMARDLSISPYFESPFALKAKFYDMDFPGGGKPDDITVLLATVAVPRDV